MGKLRFFKIFAALTVLVALVAVFMIGTVSAASIKITYNYGDFSTNSFVEEGESFVPMDMTVEDGEIFFGWVDSKGNLYPKGQGATVDGDTNLYIVKGFEVSSEDEIIDAIEKGASYIKLTENVGVYSSLTLNNGVFVIDTNGYTLTINTPVDAIVGKGSGVVFTGGGSVRHNYMGATPEFTLDSFIKLSPSSNLSTLFVTITEDTRVETPIDFISITTNISKFDKVFNASVYGSLSCNKLMHTQGISGAGFSIYDSATITTGCEYLFEDISTATSSRFVSLTIYGGTFNLSRLTSYAKDTSKYQAAILGGYFSEDITNCFPDKNYVFKQSNIPGYLIFEKCNHEGPIISGMPDSCDTPNVVLTYQCQYCNTIYKDDTSFVDGIGHFYVTEIVQPLIANEEITQEGISKVYCKRCGDVKDVITTYPNPAEVYVTVVYLDDLTNKEQTLRVPSKMLFDMDPNDTKYLKSFGTEYLTKEYEIPRRNVLSVEIPLGITRIYGSEYTHSATGERIPIGVFYDNAHLREIVLPSSVMQIEKNAFREMHMLQSIQGIEHVVGAIGSYAFYQNHTNVLIDQMTVNAGSIGQYAFNNIRMNSLTLGAGVKSIESHAFHLLEDRENGITAVNEVFVEGNTENGVSVQKALSVNGATISIGGQQFGTRAIVYTEHQCDVVVTPATCKAEGYTTHTCIYCSYVLVDQRTATLKHEFVDSGEESTCTTGGRTYRICLNCMEIEPGSLVIFDVPRENHSFTSSSANVFYDEEGGFLAYYQPFKTVCGSKNKGVGYYDQFDNPIKNGSYYICEDIYVRVAVCDRCGKPNWDTVPSNIVQWMNPLGSHDPDTKKLVTKVAPTCGDEGKGVAPCIRCAKEIDIILPVTGKSHSWGEPVVTVPPTCVSNGMQEFRCVKCTTGVKLGEIQMLDPSERASHTFDEGKVVREPTDKVAGILLFSCTMEGCDETYTEGINMLPAEVDEFPTWLIIVIIAGGVLLLGGGFLTLYFTLFKKKRASDNYKYKFNTLGK